MLQLLDEHAEQVGLLDPATGVPRPYANLYLRLIESERRALRAMESHLRTRHRPSMVAEMQGWSRRLDGDAS